VRARFARSQEQPQSFYATIHSRCCAFRDDAARITRFREIVALRPISRRPSEGGRLTRGSNAVSIDYAPVAFLSRNIELWLPKSAVAYTDHGKRRTIIEHTFTDFQLFSVQTQQVIGKPKETEKPEEKP
jgi:hypothetical protein